MNSHIYVDRGEPVVSVVRETLSDGSHVWNLIFRANEIGCVNEMKAKLAIDEIASTLRRLTMAQVLHL